VGFVLVLLPSSRSALQHTATLCNAHLLRILVNVEKLHVRHDVALRAKRTWCKTPQHPATPCNTLQHPAPHCNTLQQHCNTLHLFRLIITLEKQHVFNVMSILPTWCAPIVSVPTVEGRTSDGFPHSAYGCVCCSVLQCVAVCCSVVKCVAECCSVLQCVAACCSVLRCVVVCCSVL